MKVYNNQAQKHALTLVQEQMIRDKLKIGEWKRRAAGSYSFEPSSIYSTISIGIYYNLKKGTASIKSIFTVLDFFGVKYGIYCEPKQGIIL